MGGGAELIRRHPPFDATLGRCAIPRYQALPTRIPEAPHIWERFSRAGLCRANAEFGTGERRCKTHAAVC